MFKEVQDGQMVCQTISRRNQIKRTDVMNLASQPDVEDAKRMQVLLSKRLLAVTFSLLLHTVESQSPGLGRLDLALLQYKEVIELVYKRVRDHDNPPILEFKT